MYAGNSNLSLLLILKPKNLILVNYILCFNYARCKKFDNWESDLGI